MRQLVTTGSMGCITGFLTNEMVSSMFFFYFFNGVITYSHTGISLNCFTGGIDGLLVMNGD